MSNHELIRLLWGWFWLVLVGGIVFGGGWFFAVQPPRRLFGPQRFRAVPWSGVDVIAIIILIQLVIPIIRTALPAKYPIAWVLVLALPFQVGTMLFLPAASSGTRPYQLGLTTHRLMANLFLGYLAWLVLTPLVYVVEFLALVITSPEKHPLVEEFQTNPGLVDYLMVFLAAVIAAPVSEELLFRGVLQPWLARRRWGADAALVGAFVLALYFGLGSKADKAFPLADNPEHWQEFMRGIAPAIFVLAMIPGYIYADRLLWHWLPHPGAGRTIYAVALLFATGHSNVWPSPVPLFVLGMGLGYLAYRTQSLVSCITMHALFNGIGVLSLLWT